MQMLCVYRMWIFDKGVYIKHKEIYKFWPDFDFDFGKWAFSAEL